MFSHLNQYSGDWLNFILDSSLQLVIFFVIVSVITLLARKRSARFLHVLWLFFLIKILIPPSISMPFPEQSQFIPHLSLPIITLSAESGSAPGLAVSSYIFMTWLIVMTGLLGYFLIKNISFRMHLRYAVPLEKKQLPQSLLAQMKGMPPIRIYMTDHICSPFTVNLFKPRIYLPLSAWDWSDKQLEAVLMHEIAHIDRKDLWISLLQNLIQIVYFFHPLVWVANRQVAKYRERACDDLVIARSQQRALEYSKLLLASIDQMLQLTKCPTLINGFRQKQKALLKRFEYLINRKEEIMGKIKKGERAVLTFVCVFALVLSVLSHESKNRMANDLFPEDPAQTKSESKIKWYDTYPSPVKGFSELEKNLVVPEIVKNQGISGTAVFYVYFDDGGKVINTRVARSLDTDLDNALLEAIKDTRWNPALLNNKPVPAWVQIPIQVIMTSNGLYTISFGSITLPPPPPPPVAVKVEAIPVESPLPPPVAATPVKADVMLDAPPPPPPPHVAAKPDVVIAPLPPPVADVKAAKVSSGAKILPPPPVAATPVKADVVLDAPAPPPPPRKATAVEAVTAPLPPQGDVKIMKVQSVEKVPPLPPPVATTPAKVAALLDTPPLPEPPPRKETAEVVAAPPPPSLKIIKGVVSIETLPEPEGGIEAIKRNLVLPESLKRQRKNDKALIKVLVDAKGQVKEAEVIYGAADDDVRKKVENAIIAALKKTKWKPATKAGKPITAWVKITIKFE